jgi:hypothetical protein
MGHSNLLSEQQFSALDPMLNSASIFTARDRGQITLRAGVADAHRRSVGIAVGAFHEADPR